MKTIAPIKGLLALLLLWAGASQATTFTCQANSSWKPKANVFTLNSAISVGDDIPVGTIIYRARLVGEAMGVRCRPSDESGVGLTLYYPSRIEVINAPTSEVPGITVSPGTEKVYQTNVPGIGVAITAKGQMPYTWSGNRQTFTSINESSSTGILGETELKLVKTGPVSPGTVNAINFPQLQITFITPTIPGHTFIGFPIPFSTLSYNGTIQIVQSTCRTEVADKVVDLGSYAISDLKNFSLGTATEWKDASLRLVGCQFSPGFYNSGNTSIYLYGSGNVGQGTRTANTVRLSLNPSTPLNDALNGRMSLIQSSDSATGVGIEIGIKNGSEIKPYNFRNTEMIFTPSVDAQSLEIPIFARYYRTRDTLTPGKANGAVVYTLNYY